jgi:hypothetical protein
VGAKAIKLDNLLLDLENPRIIRAGSQREALQRIIEDQGMKLAVLAESIVSLGGLNPMDRWLVLGSEDKGKFIVYEGNRRLAALKILKDPSVLASLEVRAPIKKRLETAAKGFDQSTVEPIDCFVLSDREEGANWLPQRHTGANKGSGIVDWNGLATARFRGSDPALQALDAVLKFGGLSDEDRVDIEDGFPITTLDRLLSSTGVRAIIGVDVKQSKLLTDLPAKQALKVLRRIVTDLGFGEINVNDVKVATQQVNYAKNLDADLPDLATRTSTWQPVEDWDEATFAPPGSGQPGGSGQGGGAGGGSGSGSQGTGTGTGRTKRQRRKPERKVLIPRDCVLNVTNPKISEIEDELRSLLLSTHKHAIAVLFRVFLETSVDHYLTKQGVSLKSTDKGGHVRDKSLQGKVTETIAALVAAGVEERSLDGVAKGIHDKKNPLSIETLHAYVHNQFYSPMESDLKTAFDNARPFFEAIWK